MAYPVDPATVVGIWVGLILTLMVYSQMLYKETFLWTIAEHVSIGVTTGYIVATGIKTIMDTAVSPLTKGDALLAVPIILGLFMYAKFSKKYSHLYLWPAAIILACGMMFRTRGLVEIDIINGIAATISPLIVPGNFWAIAENLLIIISVVTSLYVFVFSKRLSATTGPTRWLRLLGQFFIMICLGAMFGNTIMARMGLLLGRLEYILKTLMIIPY